MVEIKQIEADFNPIQITLQSQDEVNILFSIFNHEKISNALKGSFVKNMFYSLDKYKTSTYEVYHKSLCEALKDTF